MVYKKYIKRGGKTYGPYFYKSVKKDGKVITEYVGKSPEKQPLKKYLLLGIFGLFIFLSLILMVTLDLTFLGRVILDVESNYQQGQLVEGTLKFSLGEEELIPASTNVAISLDNISYNYLLSDLISDETISGSFFIKDKNISGSGEGYGLIPGELYPNVSFTMEIYSKVVPETPTEEIEPSAPAEEPTEEIIPEENITEEPIPEVPTENITEEPVAEETPTEEPTTEEPTPSTPTEEPTPSTPTEEPAPEAPAEETSAETTEEPEEETKESKPEKEAPEEKKEEKESAPEPEPSEPEPSPITGEITAAFPDEMENVSIPTKKENLKLDKTIEGEVSVNNPFSYELKKGQVAEITSSSQDVDLVIEDNVAEVTTDYKGIATKELTINLTSLNIPAKDGTLTVALIYQDIELISANKKINIEPIEEINITNETLPLEEILNQTLFTIETSKATYLKNETIDLSGIIIENGTAVSDQITLEIEFNQTQIFTTNITAADGNYEYSLPADFENEGNYSIKVFYENLIAESSFFYLLNYTLLEDFVCREFKDNVLWSSGYTQSEEGSTEYSTWVPKHNCSELGESECFIAKTNVKTRFVYLPVIESTKEGEGYAQISNLEESICNNPKNGVYEKYLAHDSIKEDEVKLSSYCDGEDVLSECNIQIYSPTKKDYCYGIKIHSAQYAMVDIVEIKYSLCLKK